MNSGVDTSASGIEEGRFEGVSPVFTEVQLISEGDINILGKGKRYGRWWLLKGLQPDLSELTQYVEMLHKEFELLMKAQHPGIVQATGLEDVPGLGECIVMEYVEGTTLKEVMEQGLSSRTAARLMDELTDAVAYIHSLEAHRLRAGRHPCARLPQTVGRHGALHVARAGRRRQARRP